MAATSPAGLPTTRGELSQLVSEQVDEILRQRGGMAYTLEESDTLEKLNAQVGAMLSDKSMNRILTGPLWLSGASVVDATITADKLIVNSLEAITASMGSLNVTGNITAAASYPALTGARIVINSTEMKAYNSADTQTMSINVDGSGYFGVGATQMSWTSLGVLTVPAAAIGSLTIANVGSGTFNSNFDAGTGRVRAGGAVQRVELTSSGLLGYDTGGTNTFNLSASDGSLTMTGTFAMRNATSGARVDISQVGLRAYNSGGTQTASFSSSDGSGYLGVSGGGFSWNSSGTVVINGSLLVAGTVTAAKMNVSTLSAITADMGTITAGSITAGSVAAGTITTGTMNANRISGGAVGGSFTLGTATISIPSGGKISDADGSEWNSSGIILKSSGAYGDAIRWNQSGTDTGTITATTSGMYMYEGASVTGTSHLFLSSSAARLQQGSGGNFIQAVSGGIQTGGDIFPGTTGVTQTSNSLAYDSGGIAIELSDAAGSARFKIKDSGGTEVFGINSDGELVRPITNDSTAEGAYYGRIPIYINGSLKYISIHSA